MCLCVLSLQLGNTMTVATHTVGLRSHNDPLPKHHPYLYNQHMHHLEIVICTPEETMIEREPEFHIYVYIMGRLLCMLHHGIAKRASIVPLPLLINFWSNDQLYSQTHPLLCLREVECFNMCWHWVDNILKSRDEEKKMKENQRGLKQEKEALMMIYTATMKPMIIQRF